MVAGSSPTFDRFPFKLSSDNILLVILCLNPVPHTISKAFIRLILSLILFPDLKLSIENLNKNELVKNDVLGQELSYFDKKRKSLRDEVMRYLLS